MISLGFKELGGKIIAAGMLVASIFFLLSGDWYFGIMLLVVVLAEVGDGKYYKGE